MIASSLTFLANFTVPYETGNSATSLLWILPLLVAIAIVWKVLKLPVITSGKFIRETTVLFCSMLLGYAAVAFALYLIAHLILR
jgi:hypothetical protein